MNPAGNLLQRHMGAAFKRLSPLLQETHLDKSRLQGMVRVERGNWLAAGICEIFRLPRAQAECPLVVDCEHDVDNMIWRRRFDGFAMTSRFTRQGDYLSESLGPLTLYFRAIERDAALEYQYVKTRIFGIPLPGFLSPRVDASEQQAGDRYRFAVRVTLFPVGLLIAYGGSLELVKSKSGCNR